MRGAVAAHVLQENRVVHAPQAVTFHAGDIGAAKDAKGLSAMNSHFRHERQAIQHAVGIERRGNFRGASDFDELPVREPALFILLRDAWLRKHAH